MTLEEVARLAIAKSSASERGKALDAKAFIKVAKDSPRHSRCQVLVERGGEKWLVAAGRDWAQALERFWQWHEVNGNAQVESEVRRDAGDAGGQTR